jgi:hypothetical protein
MTAYFLPKPVEWKYETVDDCNAKIKYPVISQENLDILKDAIWKSVSGDDYVVVICPDILTLKVLEEEFYIPEKVQLVLLEDGDLVWIGRCECDEQNAT